jgi:hypothetical protein
MPSPILQKASHISISDTIQMNADISLEYLDLVLVLSDWGVVDMKKGAFLIIICLTLMLASSIAAGQVDLVDFGLIKRGMSEAEVLVRLGPPDYESFEGFSPNNLLIKSYFYFSEPGRYQDITTVIRFKGGRVVRTERLYR